MSDYRRYVKRGTKLGSRRHPDKITCPICGRVIRGKKNTIHLGFLSHWRKHKRDAKEQKR